MIRIRDAKSATARAWLKRAVPTRSAPHREIAVPEVEKMPLEQEVLRFANGGEVTKYRPKEEK